MKFLESWKINLDKIPEYTLFKKPFTEYIDIHLAKHILADDDDRLKPSLKSEFNKVVNLIDTKTNTFKCKYSPRHGLGRHYADCPDEFLTNKEPNPNYGKYYGALISQPRIIKNTIFKYQNWIDVDQKKGHPTIIYCNAKRLGIQLNAYEQYLTNFDAYVSEMITYYTKDPRDPITAKDIKLLFNRTIYGGGHKQWAKTIAEGEYFKDHRGEYITTYDEENDEHYYMVKTEPRPIKNMNKPHPFFIKYYEDTQKIIELVYNSNLDMAERICKDIPNTPNMLWKRKNRTMSYFCGVLENEITFQAYKYLHTHNLIKDRVVDWGLDGLTFPSFESESVSVNHILTELNNYVRKKTKFDLVTFVCKPFDDKEILHNAIAKREDMLIENNIDMEEQILSNIQHITFDSVAKEFEKKHCKIIDKSIFVKETENDTIIMSRTQISTSYEHLTYESVKLKEDTLEKTKQIFIRDWLLGYEDQRVYQDLGIYPNNNLCPNDHYNIWKPFAMQKVTDYIEKPIERDIILNHIRILCDNDEEVYNYICKWIGQMVQYPEVKPGVCLTIISKEGAGKGSLLQLLSLMMGTQKVFETTSPSRDVWGAFNSAMANSFLINLNELSKIETIQSQGKIKGLITDPSLTINNKGVNQFRITSYHRFIITTNNEDPIATKHDDRRNLIIRASDEKIGDKDYFTLLHKYIDDKDVVKTCFEYFMNIPDLNMFHTIPVPQTDYQNDMKEISMSPIERWLKEWTIENQNKRTDSMLTKDAFDMFNDWCSSNKVEYSLSNIQFGVRLKRLKINGLGCKHTYKGNMQIFNVKELMKTFNIEEPNIIELMMEDF